MLYILSDFDQDLLIHFAEKKYQQTLQNGRKVKNRFIYQEPLGRDIRWIL